MNRTKAAALLAILLLMPSKLWTQDGPTASVVLLMDLSYSLRLTEHGVRRQILLDRAVRRLLEDETATEWAVMSFDDLGSVRLLQPLTNNTSRIQRSLNNLELGRLSPVGTAIGWAAGYLLENAGSESKAVVLVSDGVSTSGSSFAPAVAPAIHASGVTLYVLGVEHLDNPQLREDATAVARSNGGDYFTYREAGQLRERLLGRTGPKMGAALWVADVSGLVPVLQTAATDEDQSGMGLPATLLILGLFGLLAYLGLSGLRKIRVTINEKQTHIHVAADLAVEVTFPDGRTEALVFDRSPVQFGNRQDAEFRLGGARGYFTLSWAMGEAVFASSRALLVNGVATLEQTLYTGDRIVFGGHRIIYRRLKRREVREGPELKLGPDPLPILAASLLLSVLGGIIGLTRTSLVEGPEIAAAERVLDASPDLSDAEIHTAEQEPAPRAPDHAPRIAQERRPPLVQALRSAPRAATAPITAAPAAANPAIPAPIPAAVPAPEPVSPPAPAHQPFTEPSPLLGQEGAASATELSVAAEVQSPEPPSSESKETGVIAKLTEPVRRLGPLQPPPESFLPSAPETVLVAVPPRMIGPGLSVPEQKIDILFVHAHPDDESLDFAGLMARASRAGMKTAVILFTDGESGLDQYPDRPVAGLYKDREMSGSDLSQVRVQEALQSLGLLGCDLYIRFGLPNHPYNTSLDVLSVEEIARRWGGRAELGRRIREIIRTLQPTIVVSSDYNPQAYEHFEHKAAGWLSREVLIGSESTDAIRVQGYLVAVDHFQRDDLYDELFAIDLMGVDSESGLSFREIQMAALKAHHSQGDASLIGVELLPNFRTEQYRPVFWSLKEPLEQWLDGHEPPSTSDGA